MSLSYAKRVETASQIVWRSRMMFEMHRILERENEFKVIESALDDYPWFFKLQPHANRFAALVYLAGTLTPDPPKTTQSKRTINLPDLVDEALACGMLDQADGNAALNMLGRHQNAQRGVKLIRNKSLSHRDMSVTLNEAFKRANVTANELRLLWDDALLVANLLRRASSMNELIFNVRDLRRDAKRLFTALGAVFEPEESRSVFDELFDGR